MRHHQFVSDTRHAHSGPGPIATLGWTEFAIAAAIIAAVLLLAGIVIFPWFQ
ncbi:MAG: hypothetical protein HYU53_18975 [Acidobacteria bacterium]|nr:hypothetical protein [Acidobacteriota bacterium]